MSIADNKKTINEIETFLAEKLPVKLGVNKTNELTRLIYEIARAGNLTVDDVINLFRIKDLIEEGRGELFHGIKKNLLEIRYPSILPGDNPHILPIKINESGKECLVWDFNLYPKNIFIEKDVLDLKWTEDFLKNFPNAKQIIIEKMADAVESVGKSKTITQYNTRRENLFLIKNKADFVKACPCTKEYKRCGYWILNIGFGCPIDCSYCYLQFYSNAPGLILTANIEDYYEHIEKLDRKVEKRTRIGTGEFTDSLALDKYTAYSARLIPFFRQTKNLVLELKTKISGIENVLKEEPNDNVVISWSVNTERIAKAHEKGGASMAERIDAAHRAAKRGYKLGFHFDPIVYYNGWEDEYRGIIEKLFSYPPIKKNTSWISLGTLRYAPALKQIAEERFENNLLFYEGEFFEDTDGKMRYSRRLRLDIYDKMTKWIKAFNDSCWVYPCMEPKEFWKEGKIYK